MRSLYESTCFWLQNLKIRVREKGFTEYVMEYVEKGGIVVGCE